MKDDEIIKVVIVYFFKIDKSIQRKLYVYVCFIYPNYRKYESSQIQTIPSNFVSIETQLYNVHNS